VDRFVGIGFVRPLTVRPVLGVWASVLSRPEPPFLAVFLAPGLAVAFRAALPLGVFASAGRRPVLRFALADRLAPAPLRLAALTPAPARRLEGVRVRPVVFAFFFAICGCSFLGAAEVDRQR
jgi:hypothetical protein